MIINFKPAQIKIKCFDRADYIPLNIQKNGSFYCVFFRNFKILGSVGKEDLKVRGANYN